MAEISIRFVKKEASNIRFLCDGLEIFEALDILKHESRRLLLGKLKNIIQSDPYKVKDLMYMVSLYPKKLKTKAYEQLVELALTKIISKGQQ